MSTARRFITVIATSVVLVGTLAGVASAKGNAWDRTSAKGVIWDRAVSQTV